LATGAILAIFTVIDPHFHIFPWWPGGRRETKRCKLFRNETSLDQYWQFVLLLILAFTFSHDSLAEEEKQKDISYFGNETSLDHYWQFVLLLILAFTFSHVGLAAVEKQKDIS
jgi:hypothetical protein